MNSVENSFFKCFTGDGNVPFYANVNYASGNVSNNWIDSLSAFLPGLLTLAGDIEEAVCIHFLYFSIWRMFEAFPERYNWKLLKPEVFFYPLRPELIESTYHLYRNSFMICSESNISYTLESSDLITSYRT